MEMGRRPEGILPVLVRESKNAERLENRCGLWYNISEIQLW